MCKMPQFKTAFLCKMPQFKMAFLCKMPQFGKGGLIRARLAGESVDVGRREPDRPLDVALPRLRAVHWTWEYGALLRAMVRTTAGTEEMGD